METFKATRSRHSGFPGPLEFSVAAGEHGQGSGRLRGWRECRTCRYMPAFLARRAARAFGHSAGEAHAGTSEQDWANLAWFRPQPSGNVLAVWPQEKCRRRGVSYRGVAETQRVQRGFELSAFGRGDLQTAEHAAMSRSVIAVVEQGDIPASAQTGQELCQGPRSFRKLEAIENLDPTAQSSKKRPVDLRNSMGRPHSILGRTAEAVFGHEAAGGACERAPHHAVRLLVTPGLRRSTPAPNDTLPEPLRATIQSHRIHRCRL